MSMQWPRCPRRVPIQWPEDVFPGWTLGRVLFFMSTITAASIATSVGVALLPNGHWAEGDPGVERLVCPVGREAIWTWRESVLHASPQDNVWTWNQTQALIRLAQWPRNLSFDGHMTTSSFLEHVFSDLEESQVALALPPDLWDARPRLAHYTCWKDDLVPGTPCTWIHRECGYKLGWSDTVGRIVFASWMTLVFACCFYPMIITVLTYAIGDVEQHERTTPTSNGCNSNGSG